MEAMVKRNAPSPSPAEWGSDVVADIMRALDIPYVTLNPGASFRGIHDSIVNHLGNEVPQLLLCVHEEAAVAIAHGYAKVANRPLAVALHSNVGLMHGSMGIFNAWCDRVPMIVIGATGPLDAHKRRPWIDWIHTAQDQAALIRHFIKWDDQPASAAAARWSLLEANTRAMTAPRGPVYVNFDAGLQEQALDTALDALDIGRFAPPVSPAPDARVLADAVEALNGANHPVIMMGRVSRTQKAWQSRIALAERLGATVVTDFKTGAAFPTRHPLHAAPAGYFPGKETIETIRRADAILSLDWIDLGGTLRAAFGGEAIDTRIVLASLDSHNHHGWGKEAGSPPPVDVHLLNEPDDVVSALVDVLGPGGSTYEWMPRRVPSPNDPEASLTAQNLATGLQAALGNRKTCLVRAPLSWTGEQWEFDHPLSYLGYDGGGGVGSGPGMSIGAALALRDGDFGCLPIAVIGDGDFLMNASAIWTAVQNGIPLLVVAANNRSFFNDEVHQEKVALHRHRPPENKWIGLEMSQPDIDIAGIARGHGATAFGPVGTGLELSHALDQAIAAVDAGATVVIDARIAKGYSPAMASAMRG